MAWGIRAWLFVELNCCDVPGIENGEAEDKSAKKGLTVYALGILTVIFVAMIGKNFNLLPEGVNMSVVIQF